MRKLYIFSLIALTCIIIGLAFAEQMTFTTYYPAPVGVYNEFRTASNTYLATDSGSVGIATAEPGAKLHVGGIAGSDGIMFPDGTLQTTAGGAKMTGLSGTLSQNRSTNSTSWTEVHSSLRVPFTVPPSGNVLVMLDGIAHQNTMDKASLFQFRLSSGETANAGGFYIPFPFPSSYSHNIAGMYLFSGLTSGDAKTLYIRWRVHLPGGLLSITLPNQYLRSTVVYLP